MPDLTQLGREYVRAREAKEAKERELKPLVDRHLETERALWLALEETNQKTAVLELGEGFGDIQFQRRSTTTARILDEEAAAKAAEAEGLDDELLAPVRKIRKAQANQMVAERTKSGQALPEGFDFNTRRYINMTRK